MLSLKLPNLGGSRRILSAGSLTIKLGGSGGGSLPALPLDGLVTEGAVIIAAISARRLLSSYAGAAIRLRGNGAGSPEADIPFVGGNLDTASAAAAAAANGGTAAFYRTWYDQSSNARHATQTTAAQQPEYAAGSHNKGSALGNGGGQRLDTISFTISQPFTVFAVYRRTPTGSSAALFGPLTGGGINNAIYDGNPNWVAFYGSFLTGAAADPPDNAWASMTACIKGAGSTLQVNNGTLVTGNSGSQTPNGIRLLGRSDGALGWNGFASEFIVFAGDPTSLPGWSAFKSEAHSYFTV